MNNVQVPTSEIILAVNAQTPSEPPPKHASLIVYDEQVEIGIQLVPLETHLRLGISSLH